MSDANRNVVGVESDSARPSETRAPIQLALAGLLELAIALYALALAIIGVTGGLRLGPISLHEPAKPILVLTLLVPIRLALGGRSWIGEGWQRGVSRLRATPAAAAIRWRPSAAVADATMALVVTRAATFLVAFLANLLITPARPRRIEMPFGYERFAEIFAAWDSGWYFDIARRGYYFNPDGQSSVAFFPLYPMLMRAAAWPFGGTERAVWIAGILLSCAATFLALVALHRFTERVSGDREVARRAVLFLAVFPFSLFLTRVYAESVFLLTTVLAVSRAHDGHWWRAGVWGGLAALARPNGILIALPLVLMALGGRPAARDLLRRAAALLPVPLAFSGYCAYVYGLSGDPLAWLSAQDHWGYSLGHPPWQQLQGLLEAVAEQGFYHYVADSAMAPFRLVHGVVAMLFLALTPVIFKKLGIAMGAYVLASLVVPLTSNALEGIGRYSAVLFPAFMVAGSVASPRLGEAILVIGSLFLGLFVCLFVTLHPIY